MGLSGMPDYVELVAKALRNARIGLTETDPAWYKCAEEMAAMLERNKPGFPAGILFDRVAFLNACERKP